MHYIHLHFFMHSSQSSEQHPIYPLLHPCDPMLMKHIESTPQLKHYIQDFLQLIHEDIEHLLEKQKISHLELIKTHFHDCIVLLFKRTCSSTEFEKEFRTIDEKYLLYIQEHGQLPDKTSLMEKFIIDNEE